MRTQDIQVTTPAPRRVWQNLLESDMEALPYQTPAWLDCICAMGGYEDASRLYEMPGGRQLILPMVRRKGVPGSLVTEESLPSGWDPGGLVATGTVRVEEITVILEDIVDQPVLRTCIRPNPLRVEAWDAARLSEVIRIARQCHILDLEGGFEQVWMKRFKSTTRRGVRKAERSGLVVECDTSGKLVSVFYDLYMRWTERRAQEKHLPLSFARWLARRRDPFRKFQMVAQILGDACRIWVAWLDEQPVATAIQLVYNSTAIYWRGASDKELAGPTRANVLLQKLMIEDACRAGCRYYHMGESGGVASLVDFKSRFGAQPYPNAEYCVERLPVTKLYDQYYGFKHQIEALLIRSGRR